MAIEITLTGSKEDLIAYLEQAQARHREAARGSGKGGTTELGRAQGVGEAIEALRQWAGKAAADSPPGHRDGGDGWPDGT